MKIFIFFLIFFVSLTSASHSRHRKTAKAILNDRPIIDFYQYKASARDAVMGLSWMKTVFPRFSKRPKKKTIFRSVVGIAVITRNGIKSCFEGCVVMDTVFISSVGVLTQEVTGKLIDFYGNHVSYVAASYVKHLESAGARVVPIWIGKDRQYYRRILSLVNGAFFPGGASEFNVTEGYAEAGNYIMEIAEEFNSKGDYFPVWGTCLGFELLGYIFNGNKEIREDCSSHNEAVPLKFKPDFTKSKLFRDLPSDLFEILSKENSTMNFHQYCLTEKGFQKAGLLKTWTIMSTNTDEHGMEYISTMEHKTRPYWGVQFHPEKSAYEWNPKHNTPHTANAVRANQYFADFFTTQARKSSHKFPSIEQERLYLIYNFPMTFGKPESTFTQLYFFD